MQDVSQGSAETCQNVGVSARELACLGSSMAGAVYDTAYSRHGKSSERIRARLRGKMCVHVPGDVGNNSHEHP
jgi:hypothetical protein